MFESFCALYETIIFASCEALIFVYFIYKFILNIYMYKQYSLHKVYSIVSEMQTYKITFLHQKS